MPTPDAEKIVRQYLVSDNRINDITGVVSGPRVSGRTPSSTTDPWIRLTQIFDEQRSRSMEFYRVEIQVDCFAGSDRADTNWSEAVSGQEEASLLARTAREVLYEMPEAEIEEANITGVTFGPLSRVPDSEFDPERERYLFTVNIFIRPS